MARVLQAEWFRSLMLALLIIGLALLAFGVFRYVTLTYDIGQNMAFQIMSQDQSIDPQSVSEAQGLIAANESLREMVSARNGAVIAGGAGLILIAIGWLGRDLSSARRSGQTGQAKR
jgi:hypothetical protein